MLRFPVTVRPEINDRALADVLAGVTRLFSDDAGLPNLSSE
jgi:hypothetical protein